MTNNQFFNFKENRKSLIKDLSVSNPVPEPGIKKAVEIMEKGVLYRYSCLVPEESEVSLLERDFANFTGARFALALNSCGSALYISLLSINVRPGDEVLLSAFTYTAVPSAIINANAIPILVECNEQYCIDTEDLKRKISTKTKVLVLSHMRGHISDMEEVVNICKENKILLIEDCAHSVGATYNGKHTGRFGKVGCFSTQSHKLMNSGEGGLLITDDEEIIAKAILYSGSQETFWKKHFAKSKYLEEFQEYIPNLSLRMSNLTAAILRVQIPLIFQWIEKYTENYNTLTEIISRSNYIVISEHNEKVRRGFDTIQFNLDKFNKEDVSRFVELLNMEGIQVKIFGSIGSPRYYKSWKYIKDIDKVHLPKTDKLLCNACDIRLPLWLSKENIISIGDTIIKVVNSITSTRNY